MITKMCDNCGTAECSKDKIRAGFGGRIIRLCDQCNIDLPYLPWISGHSDDNQ